MISAPRHKISVKGFERGFVFNKAYRQEINFDRKVYFPFLFLCFETFVVTYKVYHWRRVLRDRHITVYHWGQITSDVCSLRSCDPTDKA